MGKAFKPEMQVVRFGAEDVIATSGGLTAKMSWSNFSDGNVSNNTIAFGDGSSITFGSSTADEVLNTIYSKTGANSTTKIWNELRANESDPYANLNGVVPGIINGGDTSQGLWNQHYIYNAASNRFDKQ